MARLPGPSGAVRRAARRARASSSARSCTSAAGRSRRCGARRPRRRRRDLGGSAARAIRHRRRRRRALARAPPRPGARAPLAAADRPLRLRHRKLPAARRRAGDRRRRRRLDMDGTRRRGGAAAGRGCRWRGSRGDPCAPAEFGGARAVRPDGQRRRRLAGAARGRPAQAGAAAGDAAVVLDPASSHGVLRGLLGGLHAARLGPAARWRAATSGAWAPVLRRRRERSGSSTTSRY